MPKVIVPLAVGFEEIEATADAVLCDIDATSFDMIALPGGLPGAFHLAEHAELQKLLTTFDTKGKAIAAICAAPYALKTAGVLKNAYTCYPSFETKIDHTGYQREPKVVQDGNITTSKGPSTSMLFALCLVEQLCGKTKKEELSSALLLS